DAWVSMPHGPVLSMTLDFFNGGHESVPHGWATWVSDRENRMLALRDPSMIRKPEEDLLALSETDLEVLESVWENYGQYSAWD
ncbi:Panacea domain-containing protein, partial [Neisseria sp. P0003.S003]|uniref:Panacea domain-containing protein n=1 Tax=Neisseria sp. P0003.S003 TaxID=3436658 RepID=UPI003F80AE24